jgi:hypothetical protein
MKAGVNVGRKRAMATSAAALSSLVVTGCAGGGTGPAPLPAQQHPASEIVAAYGNSEQELMRVISDAKAAGKIARFVTVLNGSVEHVFPPTALIARTDHILIAHAYGHTYVWPLNNVSLVYSGAGPLQMASLPQVSAPHTDKTVMAIASFASHTARLNNKRTECNDCYVFVAASSSGVASGSHTTLQDPWQVHPDYQTWTDPNLPQSAPGVANIPMRSTLGKREDLAICTIDGFIVDSGGGYCDGIVYYYGPGYYGGSSGSPSTYTYISIGISTAGSPVSNGNVILPTAGHLYVQEWQGNWPTITPVGTILQAGNVNGLLQFATFQQNPQSDFQSFLLTNGMQTTVLYPNYWQDLVNTKDKYQSRLSIAPAYNPAGMVSNSWAYGLLLYSGDFSATEIQTNIGLDQAMSGLIPYFWQNGVQLQPNFV